MKRDQQTIDSRHAAMTALVNERQSIKVDELASLFDVSLMTVRRDLQILEDKGLLKRIHGGAESLSASGGSANALANNKIMISAYMASLIQNGDSLFMNGSLTALNSLLFLEGKNVKVITNNGKAVDMDFPDNINILLTGGILKDHIMVGDFAIRNLLQSRADKAIIGCTGISPAGEIMCAVPSELSVNEFMHSHAKEYFIVVDSSKIGRTGTYASVSLESSGTIITDEEADRSVLEQLKAR